MAKRLSFRWNQKKKSFEGKIKFVDSPIQQHLSNQDPDVDAIYRLTHKEKKNFFL